MSFDRKLFVPGGCPFLRFERVTLQARAGLEPARDLADRFDSRLDFQDKRRSRGHASYWEFVTRVVLQVCGPRY